MIGPNKKVKYCFMIPMPCLDDTSCCNDFTCTFFGTACMIATGVVGMCCFHCGCFDKQTDPQTGRPVPQPAQGGKTDKKQKKDNTMMYVAIAVVVVLGLGAYFFMGGDDDEEEDMEQVRSW